MLPASGPGEGVGEQLMIAFHPESWVAPFDLNHAVKHPLDTLEIVALLHAGGVVMAPENVANGTGYVVISPAVVVLL